jgi:hypothetical protein
MHGHVGIEHDVVGCCAVRGQSDLVGLGFAGAERHRMVLQHDGKLGASNFQSYHEPDLHNLVPRRLPWC